MVVRKEEDRNDSLTMLQQADMVVACSRADGWNLVAAEAAVLGSDRQRLVLSSRVGAADLLAPISRIVAEPASVNEIASAIADALHGPGSASVSRARLAIPTPADWWAGIVSTIGQVGRGSAQGQHPRDASEV